MFFTNNFTNRIFNNKKVNELSEKDMANFTSRCFSFGAISYIIFYFDISEKTKNNARLDGVLFCALGFPLFFLGEVILRKFYNKLVS